MYYCLEQKESVPCLQSTCNPADGFVLTGILFAREGDVSFDRCFDSIMLLMSLAICWISSHSPLFSVFVGLNKSRCQLSLSQSSFYVVNSVVIHTMV